MAVGVYDLVTLLDVVSVYKQPNPFWLKWFPNQINFETDKIAFDRVNRDYRRLAPFVAPNVQGQVMTDAGYDTVDFKPAYIKQKDIIDPDRVMVRRPGESLMTGSLSHEQRRDEVVADIMYAHMQRLTMTNEWLAANAIIYGKVTIAGPDYPAVTVDFRRDPSLTYVLTTGYKWNDTYATPLARIQAIFESIRVARNNVRNRCGAVVRDLVFGIDAWNDLINAIELQGPVNSYLTNQARGADTNLNRIADRFEDDFEFGGTLTGNGASAINCWIYSGKYRDPDTDTLTDFLPTNAVVGVSGALDGFRCFGAIKDKKAGYQALEVFPKTWEEEDPAVEYAMTQSAPLMVPRQANATFLIYVH